MSGWIDWQRTEWGDMFLSCRRTRKEPKEVGIGEALTAKPIGAASIVRPSCLAFEPPSPMYPSRPPSKRLLQSKSKRKHYPENLPEKYSVPFFISTTAGLSTGVGTAPTALEDRKFHAFAEAGEGTETGYCCSLFSKWLG